MKEQISRFFGGSDKHDEAEVKNIPVDHIVPNRYQPRTVFEDDKIDELCQTIRTHGVIQPIVVRPLDKNRFELIAGERRWRACVKLQKETIPAIVKQLNESQAASVALIENLQRENLTAIEEAAAYQKLIENHQLTQESLAQRLGKGQSTIANKLRLLHLSPACQEALRSRQLTERHARALLSVKNEQEQDRLLQTVLQEQLNVKQTENLVAKHLEKGQGEGARKNNKKLLRINYSRDTRLAINTIRESVNMISKTGMHIETDEKEHEDYLEITIKIPKKK